MKTSLLPIAAACLALAPGCAAEPLKTAVQTFSFNRDTLDVSLGKIAAAGARNIEIYIGQKIGNGPDEKVGPAMSPELLQRTQEIVRRHGLKVVSLGVCIQRKPEEVRGNCVLAAALGAEYINVQVDPPTLALYAQCAREHGLKVAVHNHASDSALPYWQPEKLLEALRDLPGVGACPDVGHYARSGGDPLRNLATLGDKIFLIHFKDMERTGDLKASPTRLGEGVLDMQGMLQELVRNRFGGYVIIELEGKAAAAPVVEDNLKQALGFLVAFNAKLPAAKGN
jgi:L-ribulose-5-phosphate 3-epimerase